MQWYYTRQGSQQGPVSEDDLRNLVRWGQLSPLDLVWNPRMGKRWTPVSTVDFLHGARPSAPGEFHTPESGTTSNHQLMIRARSSLQGNGEMAALVVLINWSVLNVTNLLRPLVHPFDFMTEAQPSMLSILQDIAFVLILLAAFRLTSPLSIGIKRFFFNLARGELGAYRRAPCRLPKRLAILLADGLPSPAHRDAGDGMGHCGTDPGGILGYEYLSITRTTLQSHDTRILFAIIGDIITLFVLLKACNYSMAGYFIADDPSLRAWEAILKSSVMMKGCVWKFFCLGFRFLGWILLLPLTLGLGALLLLPYIATSVAHFYDDVKGRADNPESGD